MSLLKIFLFSYLSISPAHANSPEDQIAFTKSGEEVILRKNGKWEMVTKKNQEGQKILIGVKDFRQSGDVCIVTFDVQNPTEVNWKTYAPTIHLVDSKNYRFGTNHLSLAIRPNQNATKESYYNSAKCSEIAKLEIDSFHYCTAYAEKGKKEQDYSGCETTLIPAKGTKVPIVVITTK